jgi:histidine triad (HIT) family protein
MSAYRQRGMRGRCSNTSFVVKVGNHVRVPEQTCPFCDVAPQDIVACSGPCIAICTQEPPAGSLMVIPTAHRAAPWDLTADEWTATQDLLSTMMRRVLDSHRPDGWNVGWNVGRVGGQSVEHAHCHLLPRYHDERYAGRGIRWLLKQPEGAVGTDSAGP